MNYHQFVTAIIGAFIFGFVAAGMLFEFSGMFDERYATNEAIHQCEQNLPRNQHCKVKITAEVSE